MPIKVTEAIDADTAVIVTLENTVGGYNDGLYQKQVPVYSKALASTQQPTPKQMEFLPSGQRVKDVKTFYLNKEVTMEEDDNPATIIHHRNKRYKVVYAGDWEDFGWFFAMGAKI